MGTQGERGEGKARMKWPGEGGEGRGGGRRWQLRRSGRGGRRRRQRDPDPDRIGREWTERGGWESGGYGLGFGGSGGLSRGRVGRSSSLVRRPVGPFGPVGQGGFLLLLLFFLLYLLSISLLF